MGRSGQGVLQAPPDPLLPHADGHDAQQVLVAGQGLHQQGADTEASHDEGEGGEHESRLW